MKKTHVIALFSVLISLLILLSGCGRVRVPKDVYPEELWAMSKDYFEREKYLEAIELLTTFTLNYSGSTLVDSAQFLLAESHFAMGEYILAEAEYGRLIQNFPESPLVDDAWLKIILSFFYMSPRYDLDQRNTVRTVVAIQDFLDEYPETDLSVRLAVKPTAWQNIRKIFTFGIWKPPRAKVEEESLFRTKVVYPSRGINFGQWLLRVFTLGIYNPQTSGLKIPPSAVVDGDWVVRKALEASRSRLARKEFKVGDLYYRMKKYPSAVIYFDTVLEQYGDTPWAKHALRMKGDSFFAMDKYEEAAAAYEKYLQVYTTSDAGVVEDRLEKCRRYLQSASVEPPQEDTPQDP